MDSDRRDKYKFILGLHVLIYTYCIHFSCNNSSKSMELSKTNCNFFRWLFIANDISFNYTEQQSGTKWSKKNWVLGWKLILCLKVFHFFVAIKLYVCFNKVTNEQIELHLDLKSLCLFNEMKHRSLGIVQKIEIEFVLISKWWYNNNSSRDHSNPVRVRTMFMRATKTKHPPFGIKH